MASMTGSRAPRRGRLVARQGRGQQGKGMKRSRALRPLSSEHHQALLVAFQIKKSLAGHAESAGAPKDLPGLLSLARRYEDAVLRNHTRAEEECLGKYLSQGDMRRLRQEHAELARLLEAARAAKPPEM